MPYGGGAGGRVGGQTRTMAIRGPCRSDREQAQEDCDRINDKVPDGVPAVRALANSLKRGAAN